MSKRLINTVLEDDDDEEEEKPEEKPEERDVMFEKLLKTRTVLLSGEINKSLAEKVIQRLILLEEAGS